MIGRVAAVTGLLGVLGGLAGALGGALIIAGLRLFLSPGWEAPSIWQILTVASGVGFGFGVVAGPTLGWTLLRRVPLWRAVGETAIAAGMAAVLALALGGGTLAFFGAPALASVAAAMRLRRSYSRVALPDRADQDGLLR